MKMNNIGIALTTSLPANGNGETFTPIKYQAPAPAQIITPDPIPNDVLSLHQQVENLYSGSVQQITTAQPNRTPAGSSAPAAFSDNTIIPNNCFDCNGDTTTTQATQQPAANVFDFNFGNIGDWIKANPYLALFIGGSIVYLFTTYKKR